MSTLGYKIGLFNSMCRLYDIGNIHFHDGEEMKWAYKTYPALITLEIPDDAVVSTPEVRYNIYKHFNITYVPIEQLSDDVLKEAFVKRCAYWPYDTYECMIHKKMRKEYTFLRDVMYNVEAHKCRCNKAKVINVELLQEDGYITSAFTNYDKRLDHDKYFYYARGKMVYPNKFYPDLTKVCSHGIHYFEDPRLAILYGIGFYHEFAYHISNNSEYICHKYFDIVNKED